MSFEPGESATGIISFEIEPEETAFYISVTPDLHNYIEKYTIVFDVD